MAQVTKAVSLSFPALPAFGAYIDARRYARENGGLVYTVHSIGGDTWLEFGQPRAPFDTDYFVVFPEGMYLVAAGSLPNVTAVTADPWP